MVLFSRYNCSSRNNSCWNRRQQHSTITIQQSTGEDCFPSYCIMIQYHYNVFSAWFWTGWTMEWFSRHNFSHRHRGGTNDNKPSQPQHNNLPVQIPSFHGDSCSNITLTSFPPRFGPVRNHITMNSSYCQCCNNKNRNRFVTHNPDNKLWMSILLSSDLIGDNKRLVGKWGRWNGFAGTSHAVTTSEPAPTTLRHYKSTIYRSNSLPFMLYHDPITQ